MTAILYRMGIEGLVAAELARVGDPHRRSALEALLVRPVPVLLDWEYGAPGERFDGWLVGRSCDEPSVRLVYCDRGFGPAFPWGCVFDDSMGMDSQWHSGLEDAAIGAGLVPAPPGYESPGPRSADPPARE